MCGVVGLLIRDPDLEPQLGSLLVPMISALSERGPDSAGIAVYSESSPVPETTGSASWQPGRTARLSLGCDTEIDWQTVCTSTKDTWGEQVAVVALSRGALIATDIAIAGPLEAWATEAWPAVRVLGRGRSVAVLKDTGYPEQTCQRHKLGAWQGYMAVAHTRMATESAITQLHSHPFVPADDLAMVHNGSFSNYASVARRLRADGMSFDSDNDSEVAARLLAARLGAGDDLEEATRWVMKELDGFFTLVITTATGLSVVRDAFACKPAVVAETPAYVAVASEYRALAHLPGVSEALVFEPGPEEVYTWTRSTATP